MINNNNDDDAEDEDDCVLVFEQTITFCAASVPASSLSRYANRISILAKCIHTTHFDAVCGVCCVYRSSKCTQIDNVCAVYSSLCLAVVVDWLLHVGVCSTLVLANGNGCLPRDTIREISEQSITGNERVRHKDTIAGTDDKMMICSRANRRHDNSSVHPLLSRTSSVYTMYESETGHKTFRCRE